MRAWVAIACGVLLVATVGCGGDDAAAQLRAQRAQQAVEAIVAELIEDPGSLYDRASPRLRGDRERGSFVGQAEDLALVLGAFGGVDRAVSVDIAESVVGRTARLRAALAFERATIDASISFEEYEGGWRLLGLDLPIPEDLESAWLEAETRRGAAPAPEAAIVLAQDILSGLERTEAWAQRAATEAALKAAAEASEAFGPYRGVARISWTRIDAAAERVRISAILDYKAGWMRAEIVLAARDDGEGDWRLHSLRIRDPHALD